jgi:acetylornithine/succinyldiaminopimelate/putrescine aminotransferase
VVRFIPPLILTQREADTALAIFEEALKKVEKTFKHRVGVKKRE